MRKRRQNRVQVKTYQPRKLDTQVVMFGYLQDSTDWRVWRYRSVSLRKAGEMVLALEAEIVRRKTENGIVEFYKEVKPSRIVTASPCTLTMATMQAVARSNERLTVAEKAHVAKFRLWPLIGDNKAVCVRPRISDAERKFAESLIAA